jgi:hypothetical protein
MLKKGFIDIGSVLGFASPLPILRSRGKGCKIDPQVEARTGTGILEQPALANSTINQENLDQVQHEIKGPTPAFR